MRDEIFSLSDTSTISIDLDVKETLIIVHGSSSLAIAPDDEMRPIYSASSAIALGSLQDILSFLN
jgi:hypothetical protein